MLKIDDVIKVDYERKRIRKETYKKIYEQFCRKIKQSTEMGYKHTLLTVPSFVFGFPPFDRNMAVVYLKRQIELGGFEVHYIEPYSMYVFWNVRSLPKQQKVKETDDGYDIEFPTLMNLKKAANKYRKSA